MRDWFSAAPRRRRSAQSPFRFSLPRQSPPATTLYGVIADDQPIVEVRLARRALSEGGSGLGQHVIRKRRVRMVSQHVATTRASHDRQAVSAHRGLVGSCESARRARPRSRGACMLIEERLWCLIPGGLMTGTATQAAAAAGACWSGACHQPTRDRAPPAAPRWRACPLLRGRARRADLARSDRPCVSRTAWRSWDARVVATCCDTIRTRHLRITCWPRPLPPLTAPAVQASLRRWADHPQ